MLCGFIRLSTNLTVKLLKKFHRDDSIKERASFGRPQTGTNWKNVLIILIDFCTSSQHNSPKIYLTENPEAYGRRLCSKKGILLKEKDVILISSTPAFFR